MGGFTLFGPRFIIKKINGKHCYCTGLVKNISEDVEDRFINCNTISRGNFNLIMDIKDSLHIGLEDVYEYKLISNTHQYYRNYEGFKLELKEDDHEKDDEMINNHRIYFIASKLGHSIKNFEGLSD